MIFDLQLLLQQMKNNNIISAYVYHMSFSTCTLNNLSKKTAKGFLQTQQ